ncbi:hypothetical protein POJ06DRAFT_297156 [Lipomyces tetrasporus]|uniref:DUF1772-domain-containing protein n=1 Tax=Lipomyces tetrasporus TaxID=54092 RepID=A0AAD7VRD9_9ASCO|nr:uncharacterized protein POJ06DRAFT_297156 [Lipomyces tetrasporus]KAJ8098065.1 hypothetical protein POJ06DRAFT_297156 [Lipomyces tetrasporus]
MSAIVNSIPHAAYPLGLGLLTTSSIFFGNIGLSLTGPLPIIKGELGEIGLNGKQKLGIASKYVVLGTFLTSALHLLAVPLLPTRNLQVLSATSAVLSLSILPYTGLVIFPTIKSLKALDKKGELTLAEEREVVILIKKWDTQHKVRFGMYGPAWAAGLAAFIGVLAL